MTTDTSRPNKDDLHGRHCYKRRKYLGTSCFCKQGETAAEKHCPEGTKCQTPDWWFDEAEGNDGAHGKD